MKLTVAEYLVKKLKFIGINNVFGLPGDYNFNILDAVLKSENINWTNCTNELNAGYSADGYARIKGFGAVVTTYGVGELSAINAIAGSYAENLSVIHIAGVPKTSFIKNRVVVHHNFAHANYYAFKRAFENVTAAAAYLDFDNAKGEIDRIIDVAVNTKMPVYLAIPIDVCSKMIDDEGFDKINYAKSDEKNLNLAAEKIMALINNARCPVFLADCLIKRFNLKKETSSIASRIKTGVFLMGKGGIEETHANFIGTYCGNFSIPSLLETVEKADLKITAGHIHADLNTGGFSTFKSADIEINKTDVVISGEKFENILIKDIIKLLAEKISKMLEIKQANKPLPASFSAMPFKKFSKITVDNLLPGIETIFEPDDIYIMDTGLMSHSGPFLKLKPDMEYLAQTLWGSIGWATPAAFGAMMADKTRNLILFTGEGAHQLTVQEMANYFEYGLCPVIFLLNNNGYTVERVLSKDPYDKFNDITTWNYSKLPEVFSNGRDFYTAKVRTVGEFYTVLEEVKKNKGKKFCYVEIFTGKMDVTKLGLKLVTNMKKFSESLEKH